MKRLKGKTALITGASKGIGEGIARVYAKEGADLILCARGAQTEKLCEELRDRYGIDAIFVPTDVADMQACERAAAAAIARFGRVDILVSNAGVCRLGSFLEASEADRDYHLDVNVKGAWNICHAVLPVMKEQKYGRVVIMSSVTGYMVADPGEAGYAMSKAALIGLTKALAREFAQDGITVNAICPGYVDTPMVQGIALQSDADDPQSVKQGIAAATPLGRLADPEEIGDLAAFLGSDESRYITGTQIVIDGGSTLPETISVGSA